MRTAGSVQPAAESRENADVLHQKQLFEKFWKGTFKAVATPRPESVIVASITARTRLTRPETKAERAPDDHQTDEMAADPKPRDDADSTVPPIGRKKHHRHRHRRRRSRRRSRRAKSASFGEELSLQPKAKKKKKRKSERKRPRRRLPSRSLSPLRKKKKKKKKSSKKNKRHRYTTKKSKHGSSSRRKRKKKDERKRKKSSRTGRRGKRRHGRSASDCPPSAEDRQTAYKKETRPTSEAKWTSGGGGAAKSVLPSASEEISIDVFVRAFPRTSVPAGRAPARLRLRQRHVVAAVRQVQRGRRERRAAAARGRRLRLGELAEQLRIRRGRRLERRRAPEERTRGFGISVRRAKISADVLQGATEHRVASRTQEEQIVGKLQIYGPTLSELVAVLCQLLLLLSLAELFDRPEAAAGQLE